MFLGSGTTCVAAKNIGREYLGFEINKEFYEIAKDRLEGITKRERERLDNGEQSLFDFM